MKILFFDWTSFADRDIVEALFALEHQVVFSRLQPEREDRDALFVSDCKKLLQHNAIEAVFTLNFSPPVAEACHQANVLYISWVYDSPQILLYHQSIKYPTNYVFLFDSVQYERLAGQGVETVYYMPMAVNTKRLDDIPDTEADKSRYSCDIAFVGSLYNEEHNLYETLEHKLSPYDAGYLQALLQAQKNVYGYFFLEDILAGSPVLNRMYKARPYAIDQNSFASPAYVYSNYFLGRKLASIERQEILSQLGQKYKVHVYTGGESKELSGVHQMGSVNYFDEMPLAFRHARINLNITLRTIQAGIPLRCFDVMGAGGFLLTNYQGDFLPLFEAGVDYDFYESREDMLYKTDYYLSHEEERKRIAENGHDKVLKYHSYEMRVRQMFEIIAEGQEAHRHG